MYGGSRLSKLNKDDIVNICFKNGVCYPVFIQKIMRNGSILIDLDLPEMAADFELKDKTPVKVTYVREDAKYEFDAIIKFGRRPWNFGQFYLVPVSEIRRIQRRKYYRLNITLDAYVRQQLEKETEEEEWTRMYTVNISGGGVLLKSHEPLPAQTKLECMIVLNEKDTVHVNGEVLDVYIDEGDKLPYRIQVSFNNINEELQDIIIGFIFREQQRRRWNNKTLLYERGEVQ